MIAIATIDEQAEFGFVIPHADVNLLAPARQELDRVWSQIGRDWAYIAERFESRIDFDSLDLMPHYLSDHNKSSYALERLDAKQADKWTAAISKRIHALRDLVVQFHSKERDLYYVEKRQLETALLKTFSEGATTTTKTTKGKEAQ